MSEETFAAETPEEKSNWGCIIGGCLGVVAIGLIGVVVAGFFAWKFTAGQIEKLTSDTPRELPVVEYTDEQIQALYSRFDQIKNAADNGEVTEPLVLTADDINALLAQSEYFRGRLAVKIENGQFFAEVSTPTDVIPAADFFLRKGGRFFNGSVTADASVVNGQLVVNIDQASVNGESIPEKLMMQVRTENFAKEFNKEQAVTDVLKLFDRGEIDGDRVILTPAGSEELLDSNNELDPITP
ncbi:hypothetical protein ACFL2H_01285 [Planctomycetota bacterium]